MVSLEKEETTTPYKVSHFLYEITRSESDSGSYATIPGKGTRSKPTNLALWAGAIETESEKHNATQRRWNLPTHANEERNSRSSNNNTQSTSETQFCIGIGFGDWKTKITRSDEAEDAAASPKSMYCTYAHHHQPIIKSMNAQHGNMYVQYTQLVAAVAIIIHQMRKWAMLCEWGAADDVRCFTFWEKLNSDRCRLLKSPIRSDGREVEAFSMFISICYVCVQYNTGFVFWYLSVCCILLSRLRVSQQPTTSAAQQTIAQCVTLFFDCIHDAFGAHNLHTWYVRCNMYDPAACTAQDRQHVRISIGGFLNGMHVKCP